MQYGAGEPENCKGKYGALKLLEGDVGSGATKAVRGGGTK